MAKTKRTASRQTELAFRTSIIAKPEHPQREKLFCPVYYPPTGEGLETLALRLAPIVAKAGWEVRIVEETDGEALEMRRKNGQTRRITRDELAAWLALLPVLADSQTLF